MKRVRPGEALAHKYPEWVIMIIACDAEGRPNIMPAGWGMVCSGDPRLVCVSIGLTRYTHRCIEETGEFVFAWAGEKQGQLVKDTGSTSGRDIDKFEKFRIRTADPAEISVPLLQGAAINLECRVTDSVLTGDHTIFIGEVVAAHLPDKPIATLLNFGGEFAAAAPIDDQT